MNKEHQRLPFKMGHHPLSPLLRMAYPLFILLISSPASAENLIPNPSVEISDSSNPDLPADWEYNSWGSTNANFAYLKNGHTGQRSLRVQITSRKDGDAKWWTKPINVPVGGGLYRVADYYRANCNSELMVQAIGANNTIQWITVQVLPASNAWTEASHTINLPDGIQQVRVLHVLRENGWLEADSFSMEREAPLIIDSGIIDSGLNRDGTPQNPIISISFDDGWTSVFEQALPILDKLQLRASHYIHAEYVDKTGYQYDYMTSKQLAQLYQKGHEIGSHALSEEWSTIIDNLEKVEEHLTKAQNILKGFGFAPVGFAPPNGAYNDHVLKKVKQHHSYMRTIKEGINTYPFDIFQLKCFIITPPITAADISHWVAQARDQKAWLILLYHRLDSSTPADTFVTPEQFQEHMTVIAQSGISVLPLGEALGIWHPSKPMDKIDAHTSLQDLQANKPNGVEFRQTTLDGSTPMEGEENKSKINSSGCQLLPIKERLFFMPSGNVGIGVILFGLYLIHVQKRKQKKSG